MTRKTKDMRVGHLATHQCSPIVWQVHILWQKQVDPKKKTLSGHIMSLVHALTATAIISLIPNVLLFAVPVELLTKPLSNGINMRYVLLAFAAGGMLGDVFLHSIPHLLGAHDHDSHDHVDVHAHEHKHEHHEHSRGHGHGAQDGDGDKHDEILQAGLMLLLGYLVFFVSERVASLRLGVHHHSHHHHNGDAEALEERDEGWDKDKDSPRRSVRGRPKKSADVAAESPAKTKHANGSLWIAMSTHLAATGWLNLIADSMHNFTDGVAIGAAYSGSGSLAAVKFLSVLFHEVPHEIGDFTILIHSGLNKWQAIQAQFLTAVAAFAGTLVGFVFSQMSHSAEAALTATTSGGFLYIATSIMTSISSDHARKSSYMQIASETLGFIIGISTMVLVALLEEHE